MTILMMMMILIRIVEATKMWQAKVNWGGIGTFLLPSLSKFE
jgi:hypothetical protein